MNKTNLSRRDFLKLSALSSAALPQVSLPRLQAEQPLNFLVVVYDSWSATNLYLDNYPRETMPNLARLAEKAIVYHNHYSSGNFTTPGTASLLTSTTTKTHRAFAGNSKTIPALTDQNLFSHFKAANYQTFAYSHNNYVNTLLRQFGDYIDERLPMDTLFLTKSGLFNWLFDRDFDVAFLSKNQIMEDVPSNSLLLSQLYNRYIQYRNEQILDTYQDTFPAGLPDTSGSYYLLNDATDYIIQHSQAKPHPTLAYYHLLPPHSPYKPPLPYLHHFDDDDLTLPTPPEHTLSEGHKKHTLLEKRRNYDNYLLYVDQEIQRLYQSLQANGTLENTVLLLTSDHGELNDRGFIHHGKATLHEPVIRIPLYIFLPGQTERVDVTEITTALDVIPTLLSLAGQPMPETSEGAVMPPFAGHSHFSTNPFFIIHSTKTHANNKVEKGTIMVIDQGYKLTKYVGYEQLPAGKALYEMYNLNSDPLELTNIINDEPEIARRLKLLIDEWMEDEALPA